MGCLVLQMLTSSDLPSLVHPEGSKDSIHLSVHPNAIRTIVSALPHHIATPKSCAPSAGIPSPKTAVNLLETDYRLPPSKVQDQCL